MRISDAALQQLKDEHPCDTFADKLVALRSHGQDRFIGPCPICSPDTASKSDSRFEVDKDGWVCAACPDGGDIIALVRRLHGLDFLPAVEWLGGVREVDPQTAKARDEQRKKDRADKDQKSAEFRERERKTLHDIWLRAAPLAGSIAELYLKRRGLVALPPSVSKRALRCVERMPYFIPGKNKGDPPEIIHRGPAMVSAIVGADGHFAGLHLTYIDLAQPKGKAVLRHPRKDDEELDAKKSRGHKQGGHVEFWSPPGATRMIVGEGIENTGMAWLALSTMGADLSRTAFWPALDLGNMAGKATQTVAHPTRKDRGNRPQRVPGPWPNMQSEAIVIPDTVDELVFLGDGDSDPFKTRLAIARAGARHARPGRAIRAVWAPAGLDLCDQGGLEGGLEQIAAEIDQ